jgi:class 3 adenylate cyclase/tetratricopeptide (TPR) repeat protein
MNCPSCGTENEAGRKFCGECGTALAVACASCGTANPPGVKFCGECGASLTSETVVPAEPEPAPVPAPAAERRLVSVLFADLVGFTSASEKRDAEETRDLLSRYFDTCRRLIELYGGTVEKFIGDAVMAVWGTPVATEDDAERAVRAALDLVAAVSALGDETGAEGLRARAGVLTGEAAVTIGAEGEGMVAGDLVNTASRIQSIAPPGTVYAGDATRRATEQTIAYEDAGSHELKGKDGLYPLFRALRVVSGARGSLKSEGLEAPFVGRDRELRLIKEVFHASVDDSAGHLVSIIGPAGIGKSRLAWEFFKYVDGIEQVLYWHRGRCLSYGEGVTYWALADMVRMRCRIAEDEQPASALDKLQAILSEHFLDEEERRFVEQRVAHLLGLEERASYDRDELFSAWRIFFERLAAVEPVVMVFEDMQWADDSLLDFIDYLLEWSRSHPIFVCTHARPEIHERRPTWGSGRRSFTSLYLEPLTANAMEQLLDGLVPGLPEELRAQILQRAEGIPLYAVETVRMMLDRGVLVQEGPVYRPVGAIRALEVPETLHALIAARLDGLQPEERRLLQDAAVLGKSFTRQALGSLSGTDDGDLDPLLRSLVRKEILSIQSDPRSPEHGQYSFVQDLLRHVAYETLTKQERRARHLAAAEHLRSSFSDEEEVVEVVASHYLDAYRAAPDAPDAAATKVKAREMLARAGERTASLAAAREAQRYFEQAAELAEDGSTHSRLQERAAVMAWRRGQAEEARLLFEQAIAEFETEGLVRAAARASAVLAEIDFTEGHPGEAAARLTAALDTLADEEPGEDVALVAAQLGRFLLLAGRGDEAAPRLEQALALGEAFDLREIFIDALTSKSMLFTNVGRVAEGEILLEAAIARAEANDFPRAAARAMNNLGVIYESTDRFAETLVITDRALVHAARAGDQGWEVLLVAGNVSSLALVGRWDDAMEVADELAQSPQSSMVANMTVHALEIDCWRGNVDRGRKRIEALLALGETEDPQALVTQALHEAIVLRAEGKPEAALERLEPALDARARVDIGSLPVKLAVIEELECADALGDTARIERVLRSIDELRPGERPPLLVAHAARFRARLTADTTAAEREFGRAEDIFRDRQLVFWLAVTELEHGEWLVAQGRSDEAEPLLAEAQETFERLEARPWLERALAVRPTQEVPV